MKILAAGGSPALVFYFTDEDMSGYGLFAIPSGEVTVAEVFNGIVDEIRNIADYMDTQLVSVNFGPVGSDENAGVQNYFNSSDHFLMKGTALFSSGFDYDKLDEAIAAVYNVSSSFSQGGSHGADGDEEKHEDGITFFYSADSFSDVIEFAEMLPEDLPDGQVYVMEGHSGKRYFVGFSGSEHDMKSCDFVAAESHLREEVIGCEHHVYEHGKRACLLSDLRRI